MPLGWMLQDSTSSLQRFPSGNKTQISCRGLRGPMRCSPCGSPFCHSLRCLNHGSPAGFFVSCGSWMEAGVIPPLGMCFCSSSPLDCWPVSLVQVLYSSVCSKSSLRPPCSPDDLPSSCFASYSLPPPSFISFPCTSCCLTYAVCLM